MNSARIARHVREREPAEMGHWNLIGMPDGKYALYHYETCMLIWQDRRGRARLVYSDIGHGSVTDQQIMNVVFDELKLPYVYRRNKRNPRIEKLQGIERT